MLGGRTAHPPGARCRGDCRILPGLGFPGLRGVDDVAGCGRTATGVQCGCVYFYVLLRMTRVLRWAGVRACVCARASDCVCDEE